MISSVEAQFISLIISTFAGITVGLLFDLYRMINYYVRPLKGFQHFMDLLFWIITGLAVFTILLRADFAMLRIYTFVGISTGVFIYFKLFTQYVLKFYIGVIGTAIKIIRIIIIFSILPFKLLYNLIWTPVNFLKKAVIRFYKTSISKIGSSLKKDTKK